MTKLIRKADAKVEQKAVAKHCPNPKKNKKPELAVQFEEWLHDNDWRYEACVRDDSSVYLYRTGVGCVDNVGDIQFRVLIEGKVIQSISFFDTRIPAKRVNAVVEFLTRANFGMKFGNFEFDYDELKVRFHLLHVKAEVDAPKMAHDVFAHLFVLPSQMFSRYVPGLRDVISGKENPKEAIDNCEKDMALPTKLWMTPSS